MCALPRLIDVAPALPLPANGRQIFTYHVSEKTGDIPLFSRVTIPFLKRSVAGTVIRRRLKTVPYPTKEALALSTAALTPLQLGLARWIARTMHGGLGYTLRLFYPPAFAAQDSSSPARRTAVGHSPAWALKALKKLSGVSGVIIERDTAARAAILADLCAAAIRGGRQALVLVPEKWLLNELETAFADKFKDGLAVMHGGLSPRARQSIWQAVSHKKVRVVIGTQSALFLPFMQLGLVIVDEEAFDTHKMWDAYPRLDNRLAAEEMARLAGAPLVLSGSFASLAVHYRLGEGQAIHLQPPAPVTVAPRLVTMSFSDRQRRASLPAELLKLLKGWQKKSGTIFILHNRRGTAAALVCRRCHHAIACQQCGVSLAVHGRGQRQYLLCHHCGTRQNLPDVCPGCRSPRLQALGTGAEKTAEDLRVLVGADNVVTITADSSSAPPSSQLAGGRGRIILGTTAAFSLLKADSLSQVVFLWPEKSLLYPDFRSSERTRALLLRLKTLLIPGREPLIVTRLPRLVREELCGEAAAAVQRSLAERRRLHYPPYAGLVRLSVSARTEEAALKRAAALRLALEALAPVGVRLLGPFRSFVLKKNSRPENHLLLQGNINVLPDLYERQSIDLVDVNPSVIL